MEWWEKQNEWFDCFKVLKVSENASDEEIRHAYRTLVKKYHPDNNNNSHDNLVQLRYVKIAYDTLKNPEKKAKYIEFTKKRKTNNEKGSQSSKKENMSFEELIKNYKEREKQLKVAIAILINKVEEREKKFSLLYDDFVNVFKSGHLNSSEFEIRKQKLRSIELSTMNSISEIMEKINKDLSHIDFSFEKKKLKKLQSELKKPEKILTSGYKEALIRTHMPNFTFKKGYATLIPISVILAVVYFTNPSHKENDVSSNIEKEVIDTSNDDIHETNSIVFSKEKLERAIKELSIDDCILFQNLPETLTSSECEEWYKTECGDFEVIRAEKDGIGYLVDIYDHHVILGNYFSFGDFDEPVFLGIDGYDYSITSDYKTLLETWPSYDEESKPFVLEGYGKVIEAEGHGGYKYLLDIKTHYPLTEYYEERSSIYYSDEFGCDTYCFTRDNSDKFYVDAHDITKVLKKDKN